MPKTPPAPAVLSHACGAVSQALKELKNTSRGTNLHIQSTLWSTLRKLSSPALRVLPEGISTMQVLTDEYAEAVDAIGTTSDLHAQQWLVDCLTETHNLLERALVYVDHRQQEKIPLSEKEGRMIESTSGLVTSLEPIAAWIWDLDLRRLDEMNHEHRWLPEHWAALDGRHRRFVAKKGDCIVSSLIVDKQEHRKQNVLLFVAGHPGFPECTHDLLEHVLADTDLPTVMAVRERRTWLYELLTKNRFRVRTSIRNHFRYQTDFEDAVIMEHIP